jgi:GH24 family phage-related lysozyme (muramidase)
MDALQMLQWLLWNEGYRTKVYLDTKGLHTVGIGFLLDDPSSGHVSVSIQASVDGVLGAGRYTAIRNGDEMTLPEVKKLYTLSFAQADKAVRSLYPNIDKFSNARQIVLHDLAFNLGGGNLAGFHNMNALINSATPDWAQVGAHLQSSLWYRQVGDRGIRDVNAVINNALPAIPQSIVDIAAKMG